MEKKSTSMLVPALTYSGIILGVVIIYSIIIDIAGANFSTFNRIFGIIIPFAGVVYAIFGFRKEYNNDVITFNRAFLFGLFISFIIGFTVTLFSYIYSHYINPELLELGKQMAEEKLLKRGMSEEMIERAMEQQQKFQTPVFMMVSGTVFFTIAGAIVSLIAAGMLKKEPKDPFAGVE